MVRKITVKLALKKASFSRYSIGSFRRRSITPFSTGYSPNSAPNRRARNLSGSSRKASNVTPAQHKKPDASPEDNTANTGIIPATAAIPQVPVGTIVPRYSNTRARAPKIAGYTTRTALERPFIGTLRTGSSYTA